MARGGKKHTPELIVSLLRQVEVGVANGKTTPAACREGSVSEQTYYRWRKEYGGLQADQARRRCLFPRCDGVKYEQLPSWQVLWDRHSITSF
jgi:hypothetical protein